MLDQTLERHILWAVYILDPDIFFNNGQALASKTEDMIEKPCCVYQMLHSICHKYSNCTFNSDCVPGANMSLVRKLPPIKVSLMKVIAPIFLHEL